MGVIVLLKTGINKNSQLISTEVIEKAKALNSTLLSDAQNLSRVMDYRIRPVSRNSSIAGTAVTVDLSPGDNLYLHQAIYLGEQGYVLVVDGKDHKSNAYLGELMALAAEAKGLSGIIIDGLVRDKSVLQNMNIPIFAKGFIPSGPHKNGPGQINTPISCGGVIVNPGDLVIGDEDGVTIVPRGKINEVFTRAKVKEGYEKERLNKINLYIKKKEAGQYPGELEPSWMNEKIKNDK